MVVSLDHDCVFESRDFGANDAINRLVSQILSNEWFEALFESLSSSVRLGPVQAWILSGRGEEVQRFHPTIAARRNGTVRFHVLCERRSGKHTGSEG